MKKRNKSDYDSTSNFGISLLNKHSANEAERSVAAESRDSIKLFWLAIHRKARDFHWFSLADQIETGKIQ